MVERLGPLALILGPVWIAIAVGLFAHALILLIRRRRVLAVNHQNKPFVLLVPPVQPVWGDGALAVLFFLFGCVTLSGAYGPLQNGLRWRVDSATITEIQVEAFRGRQDDANRIGRPIRFADSTTICEGFKHLAVAKPFYQRRGEAYYLDGYRIRLKIAGA